MGDLQTPEGGTRPRAMSLRRTLSPESIQEIESVLMISSEQINISQVDIPALDSPSCGHMLGWHLDKNEMPAQCVAIRYGLVIPAHESRITNHERIPDSRRN